MEENIPKTYELAFLIQGEEDLQVILGTLRAQGAELISEGSINKIRLAYPIKKFAEAYFGYLHFSLLPSAVNKLSEALKLDPQVIRFLIIQSLPKRGEKRAEVIKRAEMTEVPSQPIAAEAAELSNEALEKKLEEILG